MKRHLLGCVLRKRDEKASFGMCVSKEG